MLARPRWLLRAQKLKVKKVARAAAADRDNLEALSHSSSPSLSHKSSSSVSGITFLVIVFIFFLSPEFLRHRGDSFDSVFVHREPVGLPREVCLGVGRHPTETFECRVGIFERQLQILCPLVSLVVPLDVLED